MQGVCADCWGYKGDDGVAPRAPLPRAEPFRGGFTVWAGLLAVGLYVEHRWGARPFDVYIVFLIGLFILVSVACRRRTT